MFTRERLSSFGDDIAVITSEGEILKYSDIIVFSELLYKVIGHRCLVFTLCRNRPESLCGYISFVSNHIVPLLLEDSLDKDLLNILVKTYRPEYIWLPKVRSDIFYEGEIVFSAADYNLVKIDSDNHAGLYPDLALLLTTSGSTGSPKLVRLSYENIEANAKSISEYLSIKKSDRPVTTLPMSYSFGLSIINSHFLVGATLLLTAKSILEKDFWSFMKYEKATTMSGVPYTYEILKRLQFFKMDLPDLKTLTQAGGKLNIDLNKEFAEFCLNSGKRFFVMYGQTEATARMSYLPYNLSLSKLGSMGVPIPGGEFSLIDENNLVVENAETIGELVYKGKNVSLGYAESEEDLAKGDENKGVLRTGDLAKRDVDNFYYIVGRKKRFIKLFGNRINLDETERLLKNIISDCACIGEDDNMIIYITDPSRKSEIREYISKKTGLNIHAFTVKIIEAIPKNNSGKTIYSNLPI